MRKGNRIRLLVCLFASLLADGLVAMPTDAEMEKAKPILQALTSGSFAKMRAGKMSRPALAEELMGYAREADTEAARFQLIQSAFNLYMEEGQCGNAVGVYGKLLEKVADVPEGTFGRWSAGFVANLSKNGNTKDMVLLLEAAMDLKDTTSAALLSQRIRRAFPRPTGSLATALRKADERDKRQKSRKKLRAALDAAERENKPIATICEQYGLLLAEDGDWDTALLMFSRAEGQLAEIAALERLPERQKGSAVLIADYWWDRSETDKGGAAAVMRSHAVEWYRAAIAEGGLTGLKQVLVEKRLKAMGSSEGVAKRKPITIDMGDGVSMTFLPCPAGTFTMGYPNGRYEFFPHEVTITRPFWMSQYHVSGVQYNRMGQPIWVPSRFVAAREALGGDKAPQVNCTMDEILRFSEWMTEKFRNVLPNGYIIRPPTMAEWEYACRAGGNPEKDWYAKPHLTIEEKSKKAWAFEERWEILKKKGVLTGDSNPLVKEPWFYLPPSLSESKPLNAWGIGDLFGNGYPLLLDSFPRTFARKGEGDFRPSLLNWSGMDTDPLFWCDDPDASVVSQRDTEKGWGELRHFIRRDLRYLSNVFRLAIGPDLVGEKRKGKSGTVSGGDSYGVEAGPSEKQATEPKTISPVNPSDLPGKPIIVDLGMGREMTFMACPSGSFTMGFAGGNYFAFYPHKVTITRPFWIGKFPVTVDQWLRVSPRIVVPQASRSVLAALGGDKLPQTCCSRDDAEAFASRMNTVFKRYLPSGYVFRLPTMAEWEYACRANGDTKSDWSAKPHLSEDERKRYAITPEEKLEVLARNGITGAKISQQIASSRSFPFPVGTKLPNRWGICDLFGNINEWMLDTFPAVSYLTGDDMSGRVRWLEDDRDQLFWSATRDSEGCFHGNCRCEGWGTRRSVVKRSTKDPSIGFRLVIGPDLVKENRKEKGR